LGISIPDVDEKVRADVRYQAAKEGNLLKFRDKKLRKRLLKTGEAELAEASPFDRVWGIEYRAEEVGSVPRVASRMNLLGKVLMEVRGMIRAEEEEGKEKEKDGVIEGEEDDEEVGEDKLDGHDEGMISWRR
jgi:predicted NAD-dependent protein-ADP-ribosyltransferase YbiA (DUF1768 family)